MGNQALQHSLGATFGALALAMVVATVIGVWFKPPGAPVRIPDPDALVTGGCAAPVTEDSPTDYVGIGCDSPEATILILGVTTPVEDGEPDCPYGTDQLIEVWTPPVVPTATPSPTEDDPEAEEDEAEETEPEVTEIVCARNLYPPHPGDRGAGGGQVIIGDCVASVDGVLSETPCNGSGEVEPEYKILDVVADALDCPEATETEIDRWPGIEPEEPGYHVACVIAFTPDADED
ncbi:hypothetical protein STSO111631_06165 [Stackebrandtia soli]